MADQYAHAKPLVTTGINLPKPLFSDAIKETFPTYLGANLTFWTQSHAHGLGVLSGPKDRHWKTINIYQFWEQYAHARDKGNPEFRDQYAHARETPI